MMHSVFRYVELQCAVKWAYNVINFKFLQECIVNGAEWLMLWNVLQTW